MSAGASWLALVLVLLRRVLSQFRVHSSGAVQPARPGGASPAVAVVVPARDEAANILPCLLALAGQDYGRGRLTVIAVDDGSTDGTAGLIAQAARGERRVRLAEAGALPPGWLGKPNACWRGAALAGDAEWLCFVDADVRAEPGLVASAVHTAEGRGIELLSLHPAQELGSFWERLIMPAGMLMIACAQRPVREGTEVAVNGQFLLIRRSVYLAVGGHAAVRAEVCEDTALARRVAEAGYAVQVLAGERLARTRMYRDLPSLWEGFAKNAVDILGSPARTAVVSAGSAAFAVAAPALPGVLLARARRRRGAADWAGAGLAALGSAIVFGLYWGTLRHFRAPAAMTPLLPAGVTAAAALGWRSAWLRARGRVRWKGRSYSVSPGRIGQRPGAA